MTMPKIIPDGALPDTRPPSAKEKDWNANEIVLAGAPVPFTNPKPTKLGATLFSQEYTSSCVPHAFAVRAP